MRHPVPLQHLHQGPPQDANVKAQRLTLQMGHIQLDLLRNRQLIAAIDLRPTTRLDPLQTMDVLVVAVNLEILFRVGHV